MIRYIALCGYPTSGKDEVAKILERRFNLTRVDDGRALRDVCKRLYGLSEWEVTTQEGKNGTVVVNGKTVQVRDLLGWTGKCLEERFGDGIVPEIALRDAIESGRPGPFVFSSVRKTQGWTYKRTNRGLVVEVVRPGAGPSGYDFDEYDRGCVDLTVNNAGSLADLDMHVTALFTPYLVASDVV
ncbi:MAG: AAA family ATPase [Alphaproteobacteria bacterium]|nr:AAA family ATPase [Alphaproteobacteria bacterium]